MTFWDEARFDRKGRRSAWHSDHRPSTWSTWRTGSMWLLRLRLDHNAWISCPASTPRTDKLPLGYRSGLIVG